METTSKSKSEKSIVPAALATVSFSVFAGILVCVLGAPYGATLFVLAPFLAGCVAGLRASTAIGAGLILIATASSLSSTLVIIAIEGFICILMALPIILAAGFLGLVIVRIAKRIGRVARTPGCSSIALLLGVFLVGCSAIAEREYVRQDPYDSVVTSRVFPETIDHVWDELLEFRQIEGEKPILLKLGLPVPLLCVMDGKGIGAHRICYFDHGTIEQQVSVWKPPVKLELQITDVTLPGKDWLQFKSATYELEVLNTGETMVRRTTRYDSVLRPRIYWRSLERLAIQSEHQYVFNALSSKLGESAP